MGERSGGSSLGGDEQRGRFERFLVNTGVTREYWSHREEGSKRGDSHRGSPLCSNPTKDRVCLGDRLQVREGVGWSCKAGITIRNGTEKKTIKRTKH